MKRPVSNESELSRISPENWIRKVEVWCVRGIYQLRGFKASCPRRYNLHHSHRHWLAEDGKMVDLLSTARCNSITSPFHLKRPKWTHSEIKTRAHERRGKTWELVKKLKKEAIIMRNKDKKRRKTDKNDWM